MHEIRATLPPEHVGEATRLARDAGIDRVTVSEVYVHGPDAKRQVDQRGNLHAEGAGFCRGASGLPRPSRRRLFADFARAEGDRERRRSVGRDAAHERAVSGRDPGSLAIEPSHDQLRRARGGRRYSSRDRNYRRQSRCHRRRGSVSAVSRGSSRRQLRPLEPGPAPDLPWSARGCRQHGTRLCGGSPRRGDPGRTDSFHGLQEPAGQSSPSRR